MIPCNDTIQLILPNKGEVIPWNTGDNPKLPALEDVADLLASENGYCLLWHYWKAARGQISLEELPPSFVLFASQVMSILLVELNQHRIIAPNN